MNPALKSLIVLAFLLTPVVVNAQFRSAKCEVEPLWVGGGVRGSNEGLIGTFTTDRHEGVTTRSFKHADTNLIATVGIAYDFDYSKYKLHRVRLAITVSDKEQTEIFESVASSEAKTQYRKGWNLAVTKNVSHDNLVYMFTLRCWDTAGKRPFL